MRKSGERPAPVRPEECAECLGAFYGSGFTCRVCGAKLCDEDCKYEHDEGHRRDGGRA